MNKFKIYKIFGKNIQKQRIKSNFTIEQLSLKTKINKNYLIKIESGKAKRIPFSYCLRIANAINVEIALLFENL